MFKQNNMTDFLMTIIDFDNTQRSWYMIDLGTIIFQAGLEMAAHVPTYISVDMYNAWMDQFKHWVTDEYAKVYGSPVNPEELTQGCQWRQDFLYGFFSTAILPDPQNADYETAVWYCNFYESGNMPSC